MKKRQMEIFNAGRIERRQLAQRKEKQKQLYANWDRYHGRVCTDATVTTRRFISINEETYQEQVSEYRLNGTKTELNLSQFDV